MADSNLEGAVHELVDELLPENLEWERLVRSYPLTSISVAAVGGFLLARRHGLAILAALSSFASAEVAKNVSVLLGQDLD
jgi:hypothetical protein